MRLRRPRRHLMAAHRERPALRPGQLTNAVRWTSSRTHSSTAAPPKALTGTLERYRFVDEIAILMDLKGRSR